MLTITSIFGLFGYLVLVTIAGALITHCVLALDYMNMQDAMTRTGWAPVQRHPMKRPMYVLLIMLAVFVFFTSVGVLLTLFI